MTLTLFGLAVGRFAPAAPIGIPAIFRPDAINATMLSWTARPPSTRCLLLLHSEVVAANNAVRVHLLIFGFVLDAAERIERRHVVGRLVDPPEQHRDVFELHAGTFFNARNGDFGKISIRTAEIELELDFHGTCHRASPLRQVLWLNGPSTGRPPHTGDPGTYSSKIELSILADFLLLLYALRTQMGGCFLVSAYLECRTRR